MLFTILSALAALATAQAGPAVEITAPPAGLHDIDYPASALRAEAQGTTLYRVSVDPQGRVTSCTVETSSGHPVLDATTCAVVTRRARFPAAEPGVERFYRGRQVFSLGR